MAPYSERRIIVVKAADQAAANTKAAEVDTIGGATTFTVPLYPTGATAGSAVTHYWCSWQLLPAGATSIQDKLNTQLAGSSYWIYNGDSTTSTQVLSDLTLETNEAANPN